MIATSIPIRTAEGRAELTTRQRRLSQRHRTVLFLVDGKRGAAEVKQMASQAGVTESCFDELVAAGLIDWLGATNPLPTQPLQPLQTDVAVALLGPDSSLRLDADSTLPASRALHPESVSDDLAVDATGAVSEWQSLATGDVVSGQDDHPADPGFAEAKSILLRAVRAEAPLAGSLTLIRLRRAHSRGDLQELLDEVEARISKPHRALTTQQTMRRVRHLLGAADSSLLDIA